MSPDSTRRTVVIRLNPKLGDQWKAAVADPVAVIAVDGPAGRWQMEAEARPNDERWQSAAEAVECALAELKAIPPDRYDDVAVFALAPYGVAAMLGHGIWQQLAYNEGKHALYYQWTGRRYEPWGPVTFESSPAGDALSLGKTGDPDAADVALVVPITHEISHRDVEIAMAAHSWGGDIPQLHIRLVETPDVTSIRDRAHAVETAEALFSALEETKARFPNARRHLFYVGPTAILMLAARALRIPQDIIVYDMQPTGHYRPTAVFPAGVLHAPDTARPEVVLVAEDHLTEAVSRLATRLQAYRARVFFAPLSLRPGDRWDTARYDALRTAELVVVAIDSSTSEAWYRNEDICIAIDRARKDALRLVPLKLDANAEMPYGITRVINMDWPGADHELVDGVARDLVGLLRGEQNGMVPAPASGARP